MIEIFKINIFVKTLRDYLNKSFERFCLALGMVIFGINSVPVQVSFDR